MDLFPKPNVYNSILEELTILENMAPTYKEPLWEISKFIRNKIWGKINENILFCILSVYNIVFPILLKESGYDFKIVIEYLWGLSITISEKTELDVTTDAEILIEKLYKEQLDEIVMKQWIQLDASRRSEFNKEEIYSENLLKKLDEFWEQLTPDTSATFLYPLKNFSRLIRGRKGCHNNAFDLLPPTVEIAKEKQILNRWNPPSKRYLYLVDATDNMDTPEEICFEEMRISDISEDVTIADFIVSKKALNNKILNLDYDDILVKDIIQELKLRQKFETDIIIKNLQTEKNKRRNKIDREIRKHKKEIQKMCTIFAGKFLFKEICDVIFTPLSNDEDLDPILKERAYKSFHLFAEWCEDKGIAGIRYPSTRMKRIGKHGSNLVIFDADSAEPDEASFHVLRKNWV